MSGLVRPCVALVLLLCPAFAWGQSQSQSQFNAQQPLPQPPATTIRTSSDLVVVNVVVTSGSGQRNPVHGLAASDFLLLEDGRPQTIKAFEEHVAAPAGKPAPMPKLEPGTFTNYAPVSASGPLNVLLFDKLNTPLDAQNMVRDQVLKYLKQMSAGTNLAVFSLTTQLKMLQGFTANAEVLRALVEGKKALPGASPLLNDSTPGDSAGGQTMSDLFSGSLGNSPDAQTVLGNLQQFEAEQQSLLLQLRARYTLDALNLLARYLGPFPGRKNVIWFSGSFPVSILPDGSLPNPFAVVASAEDEFRETSALLSRAQVAVYPIDARGLMSSPVFNAGNSGRQYARRPGAFVNDNTNFLTRLAQEQGTMNQMAEATGGKAFANTNGLKEAVAEAIAVGSNYYTLAYTPANRDWNGDYRKVQVKVAKSGVALAYRHGYFADDPNLLANKRSRQGPNNSEAPYSAVRAAMIHGGPDPPEIVFLADVRPGSSAVEQAPAPGNQLNAKASGPYRRYAVRFIANAGDVNWDSLPGGARQCAVEFLTFVYTADGILWNMQVNGVAASVKDSEYSPGMKLQERQEISVPAKGEYYLRLGIHDLKGDRVGALEIPVSAAMKLPQAAQPPAPAPESAPK